MPALRRQGRATVNSIYPSTPAEWIALIGAVSPLSSLCRSIEVRVQRRQEQWRRMHELIEVI